jgi:protein-disulfide isomerase
MSKTKNEKAIALALTFSVIALLLSLYASLSIIGGGGGELSGQALNASIEAGIQAYIDKQQNPEAQRKAEKVANNIEDDDAIKGNADAPVSIVEFSDYECPFCGRFFTNTLGQLVENFIDPGHAKLVYRDFPLNFHPQARPAAIAAECVRKQKGDEGYYTFHDLIFENHPGVDAGVFSQYASTAGVNIGQFESCLNDPAIGKEVDKDLAAGQVSGVSGTPGFLVLMAKDESKIKELQAMELSQNGDYVIQYIETEDGSRMGVRISGAHPYATFEKAINVGL